MPPTLSQVVLGHRSLPGPFRFLSRLGVFDVPHMLFCLVLFWLVSFVFFDFDSKTLLCIIIGDENVSIRLVLFFWGVILDYGFFKA